MKTVLLRGLLDCSKLDLRVHIQKITMSYLVNLISTADTQKTPDKEPALQKALSPGNCS